MKISESFFLPDIKEEKNVFDLDIEIKEDLESSELRTTGMCKTTTAACSRHRCYGEVNDKH